MVRGNRGLLSTDRGAVALRRSGVVFIVLLGAWLAFCLVFIRHPRLDSASAADAVIVLGQPDALALKRAQELLDRGISTKLVLAVPFGAPRQCTHPPAGVDVTCFVPDPTTTQGDARGIGQLARKEGWQRIVVITWTAHITRSRILIERCFGGSVSMVDYRDSDTGLSDWAYYYLPETAGLVKAAVSTGC